MQEVTPLLEFRRVGKRFGVVHALSEVSLPVRAGEILALVGENGAGKSTLTRIMEGVYQPDAGDVVIDGAPVRLRAPVDAHAAGIRVMVAMFAPRTVQGRARWWGWERASRGDVR